MDKKLIQEIKRIKELSNINESVINEGILDDIKNFISKASEEISKTKAFQKLKDFYGKVKLGGSTFSEKPFSVTTSDDDFYKGILNGIGAPITPENMKYLYAWRKAESTKARNNPFATTKKGFGGSSVASSSAKVKNYPTPKDGIDATVATLKNGHYDCIVNGLRNDIGAINIAKCINDLETWGTGSLVLDVVKGGVSAPPKINNTTDMA